MSADGKSIISVKPTVTYIPRLGDGHGANGGLRYQAGIKLYKDGSIYREVRLLDTLRERTAALNFAQEIIEDIQSAKVLKE